MNYVDSLKAKINCLAWATPQVKVALEAEVGQASTADPETFLVELIAIHDGGVNRSPDYLENLRRLLYEYRLRVGTLTGQEAADLLNSIITATSVLTGTTLL